MYLMKLWDREERLGNTDMGQGQRVMVEYLSPNTNKPLHLGHIRNGVLGMGVSNLLEATGHTVIKANLVNDRGVHICKSMLAWQKWGDGGTPGDDRHKGRSLCWRLVRPLRTRGKEAPKFGTRDAGDASKSGNPAILKHSNSGR